MAEKIDARGRPCPQPVLLTRDALQEHDRVVVVVDNETAQRNVARMAESSGCTVAVTAQDDGIYLHIVRTASPEPAVLAPTASNPAAGPLVLVVPCDEMGRGDAELGQILIRGCFHALGEVEPLPDTVIFLNSGVRLVVEGSAVLEDLERLCQQGVEILACGTCLGFYELKDRVAVGEISNMYTIVETMFAAAKVVTL